MDLAIARNFTCFDTFFFPSIELTIINTLVIVTPILWKFIFTWTFTFATCLLAFVGKIRIVVTEIVIIIKVVFAVFLIIILANGWIQTLAF